MTGATISKKHRITQERLKEVLAYDPGTGIFKNKEQRPNAKIGDESGWKHVKGYIHLSVDGTCLKAHQAAWLYVYGEWPEKDIDHINRIKDDNRIENLRLAENKENARNTTISRNNTSGYKGVSWYKRYQKWCASIRVDRKLLHLGYFQEIGDAVSARQEAEIKHFGEYSPLKQTNSCHKSL